VLQQFRNLGYISMPEMISLVGEELKSEKKAENSPIAE